MKCSVRRTYQLSNILFIQNNVKNHGALIIQITILNPTCAQSLQSCPTLWDPMDYSLPGSSVLGILQARILEWVAISFSRDLPDPGIEPVSPAPPALQANTLSLAIREAQHTHYGHIKIYHVWIDWNTNIEKGKAKVKVTSLSLVWLFVTPWIAAHYVPLSMEFSRQEYWSGLPFPSPGIFLTQGSNPGLLHYWRSLYCLSHQGQQSK